jgi:hypothetical protein
MAEPAAPAGDPAASPGSGLPTGDDSATVKGPHSCTLRSRDGQPRPDLTCTPSAINPAVSRADIGQTIRAAGWTRTVRPAVWITDGLGQRLDLAYGLPTTNQGELDHGLSGGVARTEPMCAGQIASVMPVTRAA